jgi:hypothetical protein
MKGSHNVSAKLKVTKDVKSPSCQIIANIYIFYNFSTELGELFKHSKSQ